MKPYYEHAGITIYHGDCRSVLPHVEAQTLITDPIWPGCENIFPGVDAFALLSESLLMTTAERLAIHLGCDSDPRFLMSIPIKWKFFRVCTLDVALVGYKGRLLMTGDNAYLFGNPPPSRPGAHVIPGRMVDADSSGKQSKHPCPRKLNHVAWLVRWWSDPADTIVDPFMGSGTWTSFKNFLEDMGERPLGLTLDRVDVNGDYEPSNCRWSDWVVQANNRRVVTPEFIARWETEELEEVIGYIESELMKRGVLKR